MTPQQGYPQQGYAQHGYPQQGYFPPPSAIREGNGWAVASLVLSVVAICVGIIPFFIGFFLSIVPCLLGILFGILGLARAQRSPSRPGFGLALAGLIIGLVTFSLYFTGYGILW